MPQTMRSNTRPKYQVFSLKTLSAAVVSAMLFVNANAAGLGKLTVLSALGQPLHAEIELTSVSKDEASTLAPRIATMDAYKQANVDFNPILFQLRFAVEQRGGHHFIRVTSTQAINEPFVDMLLELGGGGTRLVREYTFLLDPADLRTSRSPQVATPVMLPLVPLPGHESESGAAAQGTPAQAAAQTPAPSSPSPEKPAGRPEKSTNHGPQPGTPAEAPGEATEYKVHTGDSLSKIANQYKQSGVSLDQMLVAMYRANPDAFMGKNMNRLRAGQILSVPNADTAGTVGTREAHGVVVAHAADFNNYRSKLAGQVAVAAPQPSIESKQSAAGKITAKVEEQPTPANEAKDKLKLSKSLAGAGTGKADEDRIAKEKALAEANSRVKDLEKNVTDLQKLLEVKNKDMADRQKQADATKAPAPVAPAAPAPAPKPATSAPVVASAPAAAPAKTPEAPAASAPASNPPVAKPKVKRVEPQPEPSLMDSLGDYLIPAGILALLAAAAGGGFYVWRKRKTEKPFEDSLMNDSSLKTNSLFGSTGGQSVDTNNSIFNSSFAPSVSQLDSNEVDPVAEADVYIAYGRDAQAEEILKEALRTQPERHAVRVKLLEIYANRKDLRSFEILATELYGMTKGEGDEWAQAAGLGHGIDPKNPLYASGKPAEPAAEPMPAVAAAPAPAPAPEPADELDLDTLLPAAPEPAPAPVPVAKAEPVEEPKKPSNELDFDLEGLSEHIEAPNTIPRPMPVEAKAEMEEINFDFLDSGNSPAPAEEPAAVAPVAAAPAPEPEMPALDIPSIELPPLAMPVEEEPQAAEAMHAPILELPTDEPKVVSSESHDIEEHHPVAAPAVVTAAAKPGGQELDFDLSGITLELHPEEGKSGLVQEAYAVHDTGGQEDYSNNAEMATKLDLAVAYQEIGDKEGARELLDEVVKGGAPEQSEKARTLLAKLG
jgi:pilus assembly protein FimV